MNNMKKIQKQWISLVFIAVLLSSNIVYASEATQIEDLEAAIAYFNEGEYNNALIILSALDSNEIRDSYLDECNRLLKTVKIESEKVATRIIDALAEQGITVDTYLFVFQAEQLKTLDLSDCDIQDLSFTASFSNLESLTLDNNEISDIYPLKDLYQLKNLSLTGNRIDDLLPLYNLSNLIELSLSDNDITELNGLEGLTKLETLDLSYNYVQSLIPVRDIGTLEILNLYCNNISYLGVFKDMTQLKELYIGQNRFNRLDGLEDLENLEVLDMRQDQHLWQEHLLDVFFDDGEIAPPKRQMHRGDVVIDDTLGSLKNLRVLVIQDAGIEDISYLTELPYLEELVLDYIGKIRYQATDISVIGELKQLKKLSLGRENSEGWDVSFVENLTNLTHLSLRGQPMSDMSSLAGLTQLEYLDISGFVDGWFWDDEDGLSDITFLTSMSDLQVLSLHGRQDIEDFTPLKSLKDIVHLEVGGTKLINLDCISHMSELQFLKISNALIASMVGVEGLKKLEYLEMQGSFADPPDSYFTSQEEMEAYYSPLNENYTMHFSADRLLGLENLKYVGYNYSPLGMSYLISHLDFRMRKHELIYRLENAQSIENLVIDPEITILTIYFDADEKDIPILDLSRVENLQQLESLNLRRVSISNLDALKDCTQLTAFQANDVGLTDISGLAGCTKMQTLELENNDISDISVLANMPLLEDLNLNNNQITDIFPIENCYYLGRLKIDYNPVKDLNSVLHMPSLSELWIDGVPYIRSPELDEFIRNIYYRWESRE